MQEESTRSEEISTTTPTGSLHWFTPNKVDGPAADVIAGIREIGVTFDVDELNATYRVEDDGGHERLTMAIGWTIVCEDGEIQCRMRGGGPSGSRDLRSRGRPGRLRWRPCGPRRFFSW